MPNVLSHKKCFYLDTDDLYIQSFVYTFSTIKRLTMTSDFSGLTNEFTYTGVITNKIMKNSKSLYMINTTCTLLFTSAQISN